MKILDLQGEDLMTRTLPRPLLSPHQQPLTFPVCTPPACSLGGWPESWRRRPGCRASLAKCPDRGAYTWDWMRILFLLRREITQEKMNTLIQTVQMRETGGTTSAGRLQSVVCRRSRLSGPSGFPWGPGTSPGVWPELHQMCLQGESLFVFFISLTNSSQRRTWLLGLIGFDAADVRRLFGHEDLHEFHQTVFKLSGRLGIRYDTIINQKNWRMESRAWVGVRVRAHHLWPFLVDHFLSAEALPHDLIVRLAHDLRRDRTTAHNHKQVFVLFLTHISASCGQTLVASSSPRWGFCWADRCSCQENLGERNIPTQFVSTLFS